MKKKLLTGLITGLFLAVAAGSAMALPTAVNVDFGSASQTLYNGAGAAFVTGNIWNGLSFTGGSNLLDSNGMVTGVSVSTTASQAYSDGGNALLGDRVFVAGSWTAFDVYISGLNNSSTYDLYLYGSNTNYASTYTVGSSTDYALGYNNSTPFVYHNNYALLTSISSINGIIDIDVDRYAGSRAAVIGGFQLVENVAPVPEPGTMMLLGIGMLGMAVYGKRRMNREA